MIVMGYPGVGKTTLSKLYHYNNYIDLETSNFGRHEGWAIEYCNVAEDLSRQGYIVLTGCHKEIHDILSISSLSSSCKLILFIRPEMNLKEVWIEGLRKRAEANGNTEKDLRALKRVEEKWEDDLCGFLSRVDNIEELVVSKESFMSNDYFMELNKAIMEWREIEKARNKKGLYRI